MAEILPKHGFHVEVVDVGLRPEWFQTPPVREKHRHQYPLRSSSVHKINFIEEDLEYWEVESVHSDNLNISEGREMSGPNGEHSSAVRDVFGLCPSTLIKVLSQCQRLSTLCLNCLDRFRVHRTAKDLHNLKDNLISLFSDLGEHKKDGEISEPSRARPNRAGIERVSHETQKSHPTFHLSTTETLHGTMQGHQLTFTLILSLELTEMPANTRPTKKAAKKYQLVPLQPLQPLPFPPIKDHKTGLVCLNKNCQQRRPHSTIYYIPQPHRNPKVGIKCHYDKGYVRTYHRDKFHSEIIEINSALSLSAYLPMDFSRIMNDAQLPSPPATQQATQSVKPSRGKKYHPCEGVNGQTAEGHKVQRNNQCSVNACSECCYHLNHKSAGCSVHTNQRKTKPKEASITTINSQTHQAPQAGDDNEHATPSGQTQGSRTFIERLPASDFRNFRTTSIQKQATERKKEERLKAASNNITMVVWPEADVCRVFRIYVPEWPTFALHESEDLKTLVHEKFGEDWNGNLRVWHVDIQVWVDMRMSMVESYSVGSPSLDSNRLLVMFPGLDEFECKDMDTHLLPVKKVSKGVMDIRRFLSPRQQETRPDVSEQVNLKNLHVISSDESSEDESNKTVARDLTDTQRLSSASPTPAPRPSASTKPPQPSTPPQPLTSNTSENEKWPHGVLMSDMKRFMDEKKKYSYPDAWNRVFGKPYKYARSTVSTYGRWLDAITEARLTPYTIDNPDHTVKEGKHHFKLEWDNNKSKKADTEDTEGTEGTSNSNSNHSRPTKRVKLHKHNHHTP
ncbi:uncharacterized protein MELLADRAFT_89150 [Melampsora larici-populina 98AG31]|uniref:Uncharacterized protein n=1 Tax=Melampsora larici-populina (strain 98AG31 / pathotype 3-4-7) TaxID=747676 RepID=F4R547_MELLP|nr:uncharacterized protein MELLADRAFT_89150 [Melampsora larici-populina 98AG31]EGG12332.1 hypothetical protein MELLADRAFT_89150 [Melampsora larici-populina 98AG31]